jgi:hypothetical protein
MVVGNARISLLVLAALAATPASASAATTIGSDLTSTTGQIGCDPPDCTISQSSQAGANAPGLRAPDGVVVRWRLRNSSGTFRFRVLGADTFSGTGIASSEPVTVTSPDIVTFETRIPIAFQSRIGVDIVGGSLLGYRDTAGGTNCSWHPAIRDGESRGSTGRECTPNNEILLNADVERDADRDGFGDETQDRCATDASTQGLCAGRCSNRQSGTPGDDSLLGTEAGDELLGRGGNDTLSGLLGDDCLIGSAGNDKLSGGAGKDQLRGDAGNDVLSGGPGDDVLLGGTGNDRITTGAGRHTLSAGAGSDNVVAANRRRDKVNCGAGRDRARVDRLDRVVGCERVSSRN